MNPIVAEFSTFHRIYVCVEAKNNLSQQIWVFWFYNPSCGQEEKLVLEDYREETRPTRRHKFQKVKHYSRFSSNRANTIQIENVPVPEEVVQAVKNWIIERIQKLTVSLDV